MWYCIYYRRGDDLKAIFSRVDLETSSKAKQIALAEEFYDCIKDLLNEEDVKELKSYFQHFKTTRLQHSINVSYYTFLWCKRLGLSYREGARAGLLHDLYLYDWKKKEQPMEGRHSVVHPQVALQTAKQLAEITPIMEDAIVKHMWPMSFHMPKYKESWVLTIADKCCALFELSLQSARAIKPSQLSIYMTTLSVFILGRIS